MEQKDDVEEPLSHGEHSSVENVIDCHSESGLTMELIVRLLHDLFGDLDKLTSIKEGFDELRILVLGISQSHHLSLEDHWSEIDVIVAHLDSLFMLLFFRHVFFSIGDHALKSIDDLIVATDLRFVVVYEVINAISALIWVQLTVDLFD